MNLFLNYFAQEQTQNSGRHPNGPLKHWLLIKGLILAVSSSPWKLKDCTLPIGNVACLSGLQFGGLLRAGEAAKIEKQLISCTSLRGPLDAIH